MIAIVLFWLKYLLGNYGACVNAKELDLTNDVRGGVNFFFKSPMPPHVLMNFVVCPLAVALKVEGRFIGPFFGTAAFIDRLYPWPQ
jgi:hypothetical protein